MKALLLALISLFIIQNRASAIGEDKLIINKDIVVLSLVRSDREHRSWKTLKLLPGKNVRWFYSCLDKDGHQLVREAYKPIKNIRDDRPLKDSHPNVAAITSLFGGITNNVASGVVGGLIVAP